MTNLYLIGFMGAGKTTAANILKEKGYAVLDTDQLIEKKAGCSVSKIFADRGEKSFRNLESAVLVECCACDHTIVSCGGGIVLKRENVIAMENSGYILYLKATAKTLYHRLMGDGSRPLLKNINRFSDFEKLVQERESFYRSAAQIVIDTDVLAPEEIAEEIEKIMSIKK